MKCPVAPSSTQRASRYRPSVPQNTGGASGHRPVLIASQVGAVATNSPAMNPAAAPKKCVVSLFTTTASPIPHIIGMTSATQS